MKKEATLLHDIAIVGGGMVGATLALMLNRALPEARITLVEAQSFESPSSLLSFDGRSTALAPTTVLTMQSVGVWQSMQAYATAIEEIQVSDKGHLGRAMFTPEDNQGEPLGHVVENRGLGMALVQKIQGSKAIEVLAPFEVSRSEQQVDGITLVCNDLKKNQERKVRSRLLLIADGADSPLRKQLGIAEQHTDYQQTAIVANVQTEQAHRGRAFERFTSQGPLALLPLDGPQGRRSAVVWTQPSDLAQQTLSLDAPSFLDALQSVFGRRLARIEKVGMRASYPLFLRVAKEQVRSNLVLMGNAAHFLHPVAGQGFNLAVRDALRLIEVLNQEALKQESLTGIGSLQVLQKYEQAQLRDQDRTIFLSNSFNQAFRHPSKALALLRNLGLMAIEHQPAVRELFLTQLSGKAESQTRVL